MSLDFVSLGNLSVRRLILGSNPFSGFSHQTPLMDVAMRSYFTTQCIKDTLRQAEGLGVNTLIARADHHVLRLLFEYWQEGGALQWIAQTCPELGSVMQGVQNAINGGAKACYIHGGSMDYMLANDQLDEVPDIIARIRDAGLAAGVAGHNPRVFEWADEHLDVDFYMCSYYNPTSRDKIAGHISGAEECFDDTDRENMATLIQRLSKPAIHYKVLAAGRNNPDDAFAYVARHLRFNDAVCVGVYPKDHPDMLTENIQLLEKHYQTAIA